MPQALMQQRNQEQNRILSADFQPRYEPNFAWKSLTSSLLALPAVRAVWVASVDSGGDWYDLSGLGKTLTYNGNPTINYSGLIPYWDLDGTGDYFSRADEADLDLIGNETYVAPAAQGFTIGGWFYPEDLVTGFQGVITKGDNTINNDNFRIFNNAGTFLCQVHNGANTYPVSQTISAANTWYFWALRFVPSTTVDSYQNDTKASFAVAIPATANNSTAPLNIGALNGGAAGAQFDGRVACAFYCAAQLSDAAIFSVFQQSKAMFGV